MLRQKVILERKAFVESANILVFFFFFFFFSQVKKQSNSGISMLPDVSVWFLRKPKHQKLFVVIKYIYIYILYIYILRKKERRTMSIWFFSVLPNAHAQCQEEGIIELQELGSSNEHKWKVLPIRSDIWSIDPDLRKNEAKWLTVQPWRRLPYHWQNLLWSKTLTAIQTIITSRRLNGDSYKSNHL